MTTGTHATIGLCTGIIISQVFQIPIIEVAAGSIIGSTFADIDQTLKIFRRKIFRHRGITHSIFVPSSLIIFVASIIFLNLGIPYWIFTGMAIGLFTHMFADLLNGKGVELLAPFSSKNYRILDLKYDGVGEKIIRALFVIAVLVYTGYNFYGRI